MKKIIMIIISALLIFALAGCKTSNLVGSVTDSDPDDSLTPKIASTEDPTTSAAMVCINGETYYFENASDAWEYANNSTNANCEFILLKDWIADPEKGFGEGSGYGDTGNLTPKDRDSEDTSFTIDLNGHTLDRNLESETKSGNIISIKKDGIFTIKNGTLTGGNTSDRGGALWFDNNETTVHLDNLVITGNHADGNGGAIFIKNSDIKVYINDVTITKNSSDNYGGGIYIQGARTFKKSKYTLSGVVFIDENSGKSDRDNLTLQSGYNVVYLSDVSNLEEGSKIWISFSDFSESLIVEQDFNDSKSLKGIEEYFHCDNTLHKVVYTLTDDCEKIREVKY